jgi:translation initiation factor IF-2
LSKVTRDFNLGVHTVVEFLASKGHTVEESPNAKIPGDLYALLERQFGQDKAEKQASQQVIQERQERESVALASAPPVPVAGAAQRPGRSAGTGVRGGPGETRGRGRRAGQTGRPCHARGRPAVVRARRKPVLSGPKTVGKIDLEAPARKPRRPRPKPTSRPGPAPAPEAKAVRWHHRCRSPRTPPEPETIRVNVEKLAGPKSLGKIELPVERERKPAERPGQGDDRGRRKRIVKPGPVNVERTVQQEQRTAPPGSALANWTRTR